MAKKEQNFYWEIISIERAKKLYFENNEVDIYQLFDDDTEALITDEADLIQAIEWGNELALKNPIK